MNLMRRFDIDDSKTGNKITIMYVPEDGNQRGYATIFVNSRIVARFNVSPSQANTLSALFQFLDN